MKILRVKFKGRLNEDARRKIAVTVREALKHGVLIHDKNLIVDVLEFDAVHIENELSSDVLGQATGPETCEGNYHCTCSDCTEGRFPTARIKP